MPLVNTKVIQQQKSKFFTLSFVNETGYSVMVECFLCIVDMPGLYQVVGWVESHPTHPAVTIKVFLLIANCL